MIEIKEVDLGKINLYDKVDKGIIHNSYKRQYLLNTLADEINKKYGDKKIINVVPEIEQDSSYISGCVYYVSATVIIEK